MTNASDATTKTIEAWFSRVEGLRVVQVNPSAAKPDEEIPPYQRPLLRLKHLLEIGGQQAMIEDASEDPDALSGYKHPERLALSAGSRTYYFEAYRA